jgi:hypothetical protein
MSVNAISEEHEQYSKSGTKAGSRISGVLRSQGHSIMRSYLNDMQGAWKF